MAETSGCTRAVLCFIGPIPLDPSSPVIVGRDWQLRQEYRHLQIESSARMPRNCSCCAGRSVRGLGSLVAALDILRVPVHAVSGNGNYMPDSPTAVKTGCNRETSFDSQALGEVVQRDTRLLSWTWWIAGSKKWFWCWIVAIKK